MPSTSKPTLRARTRTAVQSELSSVAQDLILENGYDSVTVDDISSRAGLSKRSFFRYFESKDAVLLGRYDLIGEALVSALDERPSEEPIWTSLREMFLPVVELTEDARRRDRSRSVQDVIQVTPHLHAGYLERFDRMQSGVAAVAERRLEQQGHEVDPLVVRALVGSAFACLQTATSSPQTSGERDRAGVKSMLCLAMDGIRPADRRFARAD